MRDSWWEHTWLWRNYSTGFKVATFCIIQCRALEPTLPLWIAFWQRTWMNNCMSYLLHRNWPWPCSHRRHLYAPSLRSIIYREYCVITVSHCCAPAFFYSPWARCIRIFALETDGSAQKAQTQMKLLLISLQVSYLSKNSWNQIFNIFASFLETKCFLQFS